jgi:hypothetical protein
VTVRRLVIAIAFIGIFFMAARPMIDSDTWWHLRTGQWILDQRALPNVDRFSFTRAGESWYYPGWLSEILMAGLFRLGGLTALNTLFTFLILAAFGLVYLSLEGNAFLKAGALVLAAGASEIYWSARPQMFTFLLSAVFFLCLWKFLSGGRNLLWLLPPSMVLWVNVHPGFAVGFIFLLIAVVGQGAAFLARRAPRPTEMGRRFVWLSVISLTCLILSGINPRGWTVLVYPFQTVSIQFLQNYIQEWLSPDFHLLQAQLFLILFILTWTAIAFSPRKPEAVDFFFLTIIGYMGFVAWRNTYLLSIVAPAIILRYGDPILRQLLPGWDPDHPVSRLQSVLHAGAAGICAVAVGISGVLALTPASISRVIAQQLPVRAVEYLNAHPPQGRMFNAYNFGSYMLWNLPDIPVFVDGRTDLYDDYLLDQYMTVARARPGWRDVLAAWDIRTVFVEAAAPIREVLIAEGWTVVYADDQAVVLTAPGP